MKTIEYLQQDGTKMTVVYDEKAPCFICEEPVMEASVGGTTICPWCDMGKCRYCGMTVFVFKEKIDGGRSKKELLNHMKWHRKNLTKEDKKKWGLRNE